MFSVFKQLEPNKVDNFGMQLFVSSNKNQAALGSTSPKSISIIYVEAMNLTIRTKAYERLKTILNW